jgi:WD40-like Beta Propeller Repeat
MSFDWQVQPRESGPQPGCLWFEQTRYNVCDQAGGDLARFTTSGDVSPGGPLVWSPDEQRIAFVSNRHQGAELEMYVMWSDASQPARLTVNDAVDTNPTWSPDGQQIAFASNRSGSFAIYSMQPDGTNQIFLANGEAPAWSPRS